MKFKITTVLTLVLLLMGMLTLVFDIQLVEAEPRTWTVDDDKPADFSSIQDAIDAASPGDTILVKSGRYFVGAGTRLEITKSLSLLGENPDTTFVEGSVFVSSNNVCINGFTVFANEGSGDVSHPITDLGPVSANDNDCILSNNVLMGTGVHNVDLDLPSVIISGSGWTISGNTILNYPGTHSGYGLLINGQGNTVIGNTLGNEALPATLEVRYSGNNIFYHNNFYLLRYQLGLDPGENTWDDGYLSGGNYWSDYIGVDLYSGPYQNITGSDDIGDTPHVIDENNQDNYPLMNPWGPENAIKKLIRDVENMNLQQGIDNSLDAKLTVVLNALEALNAHKRHDAVNKLESFIAEVEAQREKKLTIEQADYLIATAQAIIGLID